MQSVRGCYHVVLSSIQTWIEAHVSPSSTQVDCQREFGNSAATQNGRGFLEGFTILSFAELELRSSQCKPNGQVVVVVIAMLLCVLTPRKTSNFVLHSISADLHQNVAHAMESKYEVLEYLQMISMISDNGACVKTS